MATLHVRNVPDSLYALLRARADLEGRSIGAQAVALLQAALGEPAALEPPAFGRRRLARPRSPFLRRFAESARDLVLRARELAREIGSPEVTPGHVLLAMLEDDVLRPVLERAGIAEEDVRRTLPHGEPPTGPLPFSAETKQLLEQALRASLAAKEAAILPEHLLSALESHVGIALPPFAAPPFAAPPFAAPPFAAPAFSVPQRAAQAYRAVTLTGDWTAQLNALAADGWELFSVTPVGTETRAIFRRA